MLDMIKFIYNNMRKNDFTGKVSCDISTIILYKETYSWAKQEPVKAKINLQIFKEHSKKA